jgi:hypothetical protein
MGQAPYMGCHSYISTTSTTAHFNQLDLAQTATRTTLDTILACLDALTTKME